MNQFLHILLLGIWLIGSLVIGLEGPSSESAHREATSHSNATAPFVDLSVGTNEIVVTVRTTAASQWRFAVPVPRVVAAWVRQLLPPNADVRRKSNAPDLASTRLTHSLPNVVHS